jgi:hypothetical protein
MRVSQSLAIAIVTIGFLTLTAHADRIKLGGTWTAGQIDMRCVDAGGTVCQKRTPAPQQKASYSITSSAIETRLPDSLIPSAFAVFKLTTIRNFVACMIGKSAGFAPLRTLPT